MIVLSSGTLRVKKLLKKTSAKIFKDLKVGDTVEFTVKLQRAGSSRGRTYSTYIQFKNLNNDETSFNSFNQIANILDKFEFEEV